MRIVEHEIYVGTGPAFTVFLKAEQADAIRTSWAEVETWAAETVPPAQAKPWSLEREGDEFSIGIPNGPVLAAFLARFVPGGMAEVARGLEYRVTADSLEAVERDGGVDVSIRYVGDAGDEDTEPHDATWSDYTALAGAAAEYGLSADMTHSDHDSIEVRLVPAPIEPATVPSP